MYGFTKKYIAEVKRDEMQARQPGYRFEVKPHSWNSQGVPLTWGVGCYMPYCDAMQERFIGFIWFNSFTTLTASCMLHDEHSTVEAAQRCKDLRQIADASLCVACESIKTRGKRKRHAFGPCTECGELQGHKVTCRYRAAHASTTICRKENMQTHTAGPWHERTCTIINFEGDASHNEECAELANMETDETVCYVPVAADGKPCKNGEANARLIALAPEMLSELETLVNVLDSACAHCWGDEHPASPNECHFCVSRLAVESLIARTTQEGRRLWAHAEQEK